MSEQKRKTMRLSFSSTYAPQQLRNIEHRRTGVASIFAPWGGGSALYFYLKS